MATTLEKATKSSDPGAPVRGWRKKDFLWVTLALFLLSLGGHWTFAWRAFVDEQGAHGQPAELSGFLDEAIRDTLENWQSEFLQLIWQVAGLSFLFYIGSPQSKEGDERKEEKLDLILRSLEPDKADAWLKELEARFPKK
jgi:hypothetical protein